MRTPITSPVIAQLLLIDPDPVFRLGLKVALSELPDLPTLIEVGNFEAALQILTAANQVHLVILELAPATQRDDTTGLAFCRSLQLQFPHLPILLLTSLTDPAILQAAQQMGIAGYCPKGASTVEIARVIRQILGGQTAWSLLSSARQVTPLARGPLALLRENTRRSGLEQIDAAIATVSDQLQGQLSLLDRAIVAGRYRELRAARWLVNRLLTVAPSPIDPVREPQAQSSGSAREPEPEGALVPNTAGPMRLQSVQSVLFDNLVIRLQSPLSNLTSSPLEIDILREEKKRELLYLVLRKLEDSLSELRLSQVQSEQLAAKQAVLLRDLWQATLTDFLGKYYTVRLDRGLQVEVVPTLLQDYSLVATEILQQIPLVPELLAHLLFQAPLMVDNVSCAMGSPEAMAQASQLLENLMLQVANAVMQPLLNRFADIDVIKQGFYDRRLISTRDIERFRNDLSWRYRLQRYVGEPKAIFESQYLLLTLTEQGIQQKSIYAPRRQELEQLKGVQFSVTLLLEARDAIAPRLRTSVAWLGSGLIYVLTNVIGRGLGLIGRGVLQGIGNVWQDTRQR